MGCSSCSTSADGSPKGCGNKGHCSTGGCNKRNTFDWLAHIDLPDYGAYDLVEISFKKGARKEIYKKPEGIYLASGDYVAVEGLAGGFDVGQISLMGELVQLQLPKHRIRPNTIIPNILRPANERDLEKLEEARNMEYETLIRARVIARNLGLDMKVGDVEYQGDKRKVTFYYTADGRVDFRELIRAYAKEFRVKIEMRQIGSRQESARIGGIGSCGRELCCSTWLSDFKSVSTAAARYQNLAINQSKLSGQCGRLKCCLNYELNTYLEVLKEFPKNVDRIRTKKGIAILIKTDIFKRIMYYAYRNEIGISEIHQLSTQQVWELKGLNEKGIEPETILDIETKNNFIQEKEKEIEFVDNIDGVLQLRPLEKKRKNRRNNRSKNRNKNKTKAAAKDNNKPKPTQSKGSSTPTNKKAKGDSKSTPLQNKKKKKTVSNKPMGNSNRSKNTIVDNKINNNDKRSQNKNKNRNQNTNRNRNRTRNKNRKPNNNNKSNDKE